MIKHASGCIDQYEYPNEKDTTPAQCDSIGVGRSLFVCGKTFVHRNRMVQCLYRDNNRRWSYGNEYDAKRCHHASQHYGGGALPSGSFERCKTPDEVYDMTGNLWEWNGSGILRGGNWNFFRMIGAMSVNCQTCIPHPQ